MHLYRKVPADGVAKVANRMDYKDGVSCSLGKLEFVCFHGVLFLYYITSYVIFTDVMPLNFGY